MIAIGVGCSAAFSAAFTLRVPIQARRRLAPRMEQGSFQLSPELGQQDRPARIRCPHCDWQPHRHDQWGCFPVGAPEYFDGGCGASWNTFDTRGLCPGCGYQWRHTMCLSCGAWSLHDEWYEHGSGDPDSA